MATAPWCGVVASLPYPGAADRQAVEAVLRAIRPACDAQIVSRGQERARTETARCIVALGCIPASFQAETGARPGRFLPLVFVRTPVGRKADVFRASSHCEMIGLRTCDARCCPSSPGASFRESLHACHERFALNPAVARSPVLKDAHAGLFTLEHGCHAHGGDSRPVAPHHRLHPGASLVRPVRGRAPLRPRHLVRTAQAGGIVQVVLDRADQSCPLPCLSTERGLP